MSVTDGDLFERMAKKHSVSPAAVQVVLAALRSGGGRMAQFSHADFGGMSQWSPGMSMVGDMFNTQLEAFARWTIFVSKSEGLVLRAESRAAYHSPTSRLELPGVVCSSMRREVQSKKHVHPCCRFSLEVRPAPIDEPQSGAATG
jgi:hypothetical protein